MWKKMVKTKIEKIIEEEVIQKTGEMTKMRLIKSFKKQEYVSECSMALVKDIMKIRLNMAYYICYIVGHGLNMVEIGENFKGKYGQKYCMACNEEKETTEHVIQCGQYKKLTGHKMTLTEGCFEDTKWLINATMEYKMIEETRDILNKCI